VFSWFVFTDRAMQLKWSNASAADGDGLSAGFQLFRCACDVRYFSSPNLAIGLRWFHGRLGGPLLVFAEKKLWTKRIGFGGPQTEHPPIRISQSSLNGI
jgi:hypothetical protein